MSPSLSPIPPSPSVNGTLSRALRFEIADDENRALLGSYAISTSLGVAFLLLLQFGPRAEQIIRVFPERVPPIGFRYIDPPTPTVYPSALTRASAATPANGTSAIGRAFAIGGASSGAGRTTDVSGLLRGVAVNDSRTSATDVGSRDKAVLAYGEGGTGSAVPGRRAGAADGAGDGSGIGGVGKGAGVGRSAVAVSLPVVVPVSPLDRGGRDVTEVGTYVRSHEAELRFCYQERGLALDPKLGGSITVAVTVAASGAVRDASVTRRSWSGAAAEAAEACILRSIRGWRLPAADGGVGTYSLPFSFTR